MKEISLKVHFINVQKASIQYNLDVVIHNLAKEMNNKLHYKIKIRKAPRLIKLHCIVASCINYLNNPAPNEMMVTSTSVILKGYLGFRKA